MRFGIYFALLIQTFWLLSCGADSYAVVSVRDQKVAVVKRGELEQVYPVSTSKFGLGDIPRSHRTPLGTMTVAKKIGAGYPAGAVFKSRKFTGEIIPPNAPGRDPIITRILWLKGTERRNRHAFERYIYIHGTPEERTIGTPASYGCIRMKSVDVMRLFKSLKLGSKVIVMSDQLPLELLAAGNAGKKKSAFTRADTASD